MTTSSKVRREDPTPLRLALVLWNGTIGGAEMVTAALAREMGRLGVSAGVVFVGHDEPVASVLRETGVSYRTLGLARGAHLLLHPKWFANVVTDVGADGVLLNSIGLQAIALRLGGYQGRIVSVEHGAILQLADLPKDRQLVKKCERLMGIYATDIQVAVSDFILSKMSRRPLPHEVVRIQNGVDLTRYVPSTDREDPDTYVVGWAGRLVPGKGVDDLIRAVAILAPEIHVKLHVAGDGPERASLESLADGLGVPDRVVFGHWITDMPSFWRRCDVAAFPTNGCIESFGLAAVEAMGSGRPVIVSRAGGLTETVEDGKTGTFITPGAVNELARALRRYAVDRHLRFEHGSRARARCEKKFDIRTMAERYVALYSNH